VLSLGIYLGGSGALAQDPVSRDAVRRRRPLDAGERRSVRAIVAVCAAVMLFWAAYDQQANTVLLWAEDFTDRSIDLWLWRGEIPSPWFLALNPLMVFLLAPLIVRIWAEQARRGTESSPIGKMAFGCACLACANLLMASAAWSAAGKASALWLVGYFALATIGELHLAPVGLALVYRLAPARIVSMMMGVWFAATLPGDILAGFLGGYWSTMTRANFFLIIAAVAALAGLAVSALRGALINASTDRDA
jgi:POT family proton-dependent oligopeptide transporter